MFINFKHLKLLVFKIFLIFSPQDKRSQIFREIETTKSKTVIYHSKIIQLNKNLEQKEKEKAAFDQTLDYLK